MEYSWILSLSFFATKCSISSIRMVSLLLWYCDPVQPQMQVKEVTSYLEGWHQAACTRTSWSYVPDDVRSVGEGPHGGGFTSRDRLTRSSWRIVCADVPNSVKCICCSRSAYSARFALLTAYPRLQRGNGSLDWSFHDFFIFCACLGHFFPVSGI